MLIKLMLSIMLGLIALCIILTGELMQRKKPNSNAKINSLILAIMTIALALGIMTKDVIRILDEWSL